MATKFDIVQRWPGLFVELDEPRRRAVVESLANAWRAGWVPNREDVEIVINESRGTPDAEEGRRRAFAAAMRLPMKPSRRKFFRDLKPYEIPDSLADLKGPVRGSVDLPHTVFWAPGGGRVDLDSQAGAALAYRAVLSEGTVADQVAVLNRERLIALWPELLLPQRVRELWEARFPELSAGVSV